MNPVTWSSCLMVLGRTGGQSQGSGSTTTSYMRKKSSPGVCSDFIMLRQGNIDQAWQALCASTASGVRSKLGFLRLVFLAEQLQGESAWRALCVQDNGTECSARQTSGQPCAQQYGDGPRRLRLAKQCPWPTTIKRLTKQRQQQRQHQHQQHHHQQQQQVETILLISWLCSRLQNCSVPLCQSALPKSTVRWFSSSSMA